MNPSTSNNPPDSLYPSKAVLISSSSSVSASEPTRNQSSAALSIATLPQIPKEDIPATTSSTTINKSPLIRSVNELCDSIFLSPIPDGVKLSFSQKLHNMVNHSWHTAVLAFNASAYLASTSMIASSLYGVLKASTISGVFSQAFSGIVGFGLGALSFKLFSGTVVESNKRHAAFIQGLLTAQAPECVCKLRDMIPTFRQILAVQGLRRVTSAEFNNLRPLSRLESLGCHLLQLTGTAITAAGIATAIYGAYAGLNLPSVTHNPRFLLSTLVILSGGILGNIGVRLGGAFVQEGVERRFHDNKIEFRSPTEV